jgi:hypothetical protein
LFACHLSHFLSIDSVTTSKVIISIRKEPELYNLILIVEPE